MNSRKWGELLGRYIFGFKERLWEINIEGRDQRLQAGFAVEVSVEVIFKAIKRGLRITRNPLFLFGSGGWI